MSSSFSFSISFISFSCLFALAKASNMILKRSAGRGHPCCVSNLSGKVSGFSPLSNVSCRLFVDFLY